MMYDSVKLGAVTQWTYAPDGLALADSQRVARLIDRFGPCAMVRVPRGPITTDEQQVKLRAMLKEAEDDVRPVMRA